MSGTPSVKKALRLALIAFDNVFSTQWENSTFAPVDSVPYQKVNFVFAEPQNPEISGGFYKENGYMQVQLFYPVGPGEGAADLRAQAIRDYFKMGLSFSADGINVTIDRTPYIAQGATDGNRYAVPVKIRFFANNAT